MEKKTIINMPSEVIINIDKNIGMKQFAKNTNQLFHFEKRMIDSHVFSDFHKMKGLENAFLTWDDKTIDAYSKDDTSLALFCKMGQRVLSMRALSKPASDLWVQSCFSKNYRKLFNVIDLTPEQIIELIYTTDSSASFMQSIESKILDDSITPKDSIMKKVMSLLSQMQVEANMQNAMMALENLANSASCLYFYEDAVRFVVQTDCEYTNDVLSWIPKDIINHYSVQDIFKHREDVMVDFRLRDNNFSAYTIRLESIADHVAVHNQAGNILAETDNAKMLSIYHVEDDNCFTNYTQIILVEDCLNEGKERVFVTQHTTDFDCQFGCTRINRCVITRSDKRGKLPVEVCSLKRTKIEQDKCLCNFVLPFSVLSLCAYVLDCYANRNTLGKQQGLRDSFYQKIPVSAHLKSYEKDIVNSESHIMPLHEYYEMEKTNIQSGNTRVAERTRKKVGEFNDMTSWFSVIPTTNTTRTKFRS